MPYTCLCSAARTADPQTASWAGLNSVPLTPQGTPGSCKGRQPESKGGEETYSMSDYLKSFFLQAVSRTIPYPLTSPKFTVP